MPASRRVILISIFLVLGLGFPDITFCNFSANKPILNSPDSIIDTKVLYNGRIWRNLYTNVENDQFLFSNSFLSGSVTINDKTFNNIRIRYDIYNDEIMTITENGLVIQLNKEMVSTFTINFDNSVHKFIKLSPDSLKTIIGYVDVIYDGPTALYIKYGKKIKVHDMAVKYESFYQYRQVCILKEGASYLVKSKREYIGLLKDKREQVAIFTKNHKLYGLKNDPEIFVPVLKFYDSLTP